MSRQQINIIVFCFIYAVVFVLVFYKAIHVPITHDEPTTPLIHVNHSYWEIMMFPDTSPNNHILNSLAVKFFMTFLPNEQWVIRLPNVLSFLVLTFGAWKLLKNSVGKSSIFFIPGALIFVCNPFLLDFFGLCRGYGISNAFTLLAAAFIVEGFKQQKERSIWVGLLCGILASYANFSALMVWLGVSTAVGIFHVWQWKGTKLWTRLGMQLVVTAAYLWLISFPIRKMQSGNEFRFWTSKGFYHETMISLIRASRYFESLFLYLFTDYLIATIVIGTLVIVGGVLIYKIKKDGTNVFSSPVFSSWMILVVAISASILQSWLLKTPNLNGRTALFYFVLYGAFVVTCFPWLEQKLKKLYLRIGLPSLMSFILVFHMINVFNVQSVWEWSYDQDTFKVLSYLKNKSTDNNDQVYRLRTHWLFHPSFFYYSRIGKTEWVDLADYRKKMNPEATEDYYYLRIQDSSYVTGSYVLEKKFGGDRLLMRKQK